MKNLIQHTTELAMSIAKQYIRPNGLVIDATCGNGHDTLALAKAIWPAEPTGRATGTGAARLLAFDVQKAAIENTRTALVEAGFGSQLESGQIVLIQDDHANMAKHIDVLFGWSADGHANTADCTTETMTGASLIVFNLGYLPGGDKQVTTESDSTLSAVEAALDLLNKDGLICITMYSGHEAINMVNQANDPPEILLISRKR